jgi:hypothetical protein
MWLCLFSAGLYAQNQTTPGGGSFVGHFAAEHANTSVIADITQNNTLVRGTLMMDGETYQILGTTTGKNTFSGKLVDGAKNKFFDIAAQIHRDTLSLAILFPERGKQVVNVLLTKTGRTQAPAPAHSKEKSPRLIGTWRYTEVLSSGFGNNAAALVTDTFVQYKANGERLSWVGSSAGGSQDVRLQSRGKGEVTVMHWYTEGSLLTLIDPQTQESSSIGFFADGDRMMLKGSGRVYERVR